MKYELIDQLSDNGYSSSVCFLAEKSGEKFDDGKRTRLVDRAFFAELRKNDLSDLARVCV